MKDPYTKMAHMLRTQPAILLELDRKMSVLTGQEGVMEDILRQNDITVDQTLAGLGMTRKDGPKMVQEALIERLRHLDGHLRDMLGEPDLTKTAEACQKLCGAVHKVFTPAKGFFLKHERVIAALEKYPPHTLVEHFSYTGVAQLLEKEGFAPVMAALRFSQSESWMHQFFDIAYNDLGPDDFEEREVEELILDPKWVAVAEKFLHRKHHNVSHLKEVGIIFIIPTGLQEQGATLRLFTLMLHYLHEVPFYANLFRHYAYEPNFTQKFKSLLRGDVPTEPILNGSRIVWRIVQRYLAKDNADDFRLFEPHVSPEADHWWRAEEDLGRLSRILGNDHGRLDLGWWTGLDFVGESFTDSQTGISELVSFDLIDLLMSLVQRDRVKYLYHQQEALWNKIFIEYLGRERMQELIEENLVNGFITLT